MAPTDEESQYNEFVKVAKKQPSSFFMRDQHLIADATQLEICGVGDVDVLDDFNRMSTGNFGIYAYETTAEWSRKPVNVYPQHIMTHTQEGMAAALALRQLLADALN